MSNKTPFEIRLELLKMAKEMLEQEYFGKMDAINQKYSFQLDEANRKGLPVPDRDAISFPTEAQVIAKATELNAFVSNG